MIFSRLITVLILSLILLSCQSHKNELKDSEITTANWRLVTTDSQFSFVTTKNKNFTEEHTIAFSEGYISKEKKLMLSLDLSTVDTQIAIRDQRLKDILFDVEQNPVAKITAELDRRLPLMEPFEVSFDLNLHGTTQTMSALVMLQSVNDQLVVTNFEPVLVNGKDFGLDGAINQLTKIAGLQSINYSVLVDFKLTFEM